MCIQKSNLHNKTVVVGLLDFEPKVSFKYIRIMPMHIFNTNILHGMIVLVTVAINNLQ